MHILLNLSSPIVDRKYVLICLNILKKRSAVKLVAGRNKIISKATAIGTWKLEKTYSYNLTN